MSVRHSRRANSHAKGQDKVSGDADAGKSMTYVVFLLRLGRASYTREAWSPKETPDTSDVTLSEPRTIVFLKSELCPPTSMPKGPRVVEIINECHIWIQRTRVLY